MNSARGLALEELLGLVVEVVELALDDRDDVARDVLVGLGVLKRADLALAVLLLVLLHVELIRRLGGSGGGGRCGGRSRFHRKFLPALVKGTTSVSA